MSLRHRHVLGLRLLPPTVPPAVPSVRHLCVLLELRTRNVFFELRRLAHEPLSLRLRREP